MSTKAQQIEKRVDEIIEANDIKKRLLEHVRRLCASGGVEVSEHCDEEGQGCFLLPKLLLCEALRRESEQYAPFNSTHKRTLKSLRHF